MPILPENQNARWGAGLAASAAVYVGAHIVDPTANIDANNVAGTLEWLSIVGGSISTYALSMNSIAAFHRHNRRKNEEKALQFLPEFRNVTGHVPAIATALINKYGIGALASEDLRPIADTDNVDYLTRLGYSEAERVMKVAETMTNNLVVLRKHPARTRSLADSGLRAIDTGLILDKVYPIQPNDTKTPETVPGERHWFDFAERAAAQQLAAA